MDTEMVGRHKEREIVLEKRIHINNGDDIVCDCMLEYYSTPPKSEQPDSDEDRKETNQPPEDWLPITQSRKGNSWTATFHLLTSGIGIQTLSLPLAFMYLGWFWGIMCLSVAFVWQFYTILLLVDLHESTSTTRYSRYLQLSVAAFGVKLGKVLAIFPVMYLSGGSCVMFIITGGGTMKLFYQLLCEDCSTKYPLTTTEWFLVFICLAILVSLFCPNLNSLAFVSFLGSIMAVGYCTILWLFFVAKRRVDGVTYDQSKVAESETTRMRNIMNALGIIFLAFRGHNVVLEIQGTLPSTPNRSSSNLMLKGVVASYLIIAMCFFPLTAAEYWALGNKIPANGGLLTALLTTLHHHTLKPVVGLLYVQVVVSCVAAFQIYGMVVYDNLERAYASRKSQKCPKLTRIGIRIFFGGLTFFISVAFPFLPSLGLLIGGIALPVTYAYPCLMWIAIKKPPIKSAMWWLNLVLGCLGVGLSVLLVICAVWNLACVGLDANFFHPY
ncbi:unnamed protein product [Lactuca saligna]|uniref:Amino acid transporter transmembrane domain-containing protein n=1 Tax=Lactuca saligna TaxID=75948 RepID=A0AA35YUC8_LACSI|nr:unnamed protein product [Lactuca saligna]